MKKRLGLFQRHKSTLSGALRRFVLSGASLLLIVTLALSDLPSHASASQLLTRSLTLSSSISSDTGVQYKFAFTVQSTTTLQTMKFQACTTALGSCIAPNTLDFSSATFVSQNGWAGATNFTVDTTNANGCTATASIICARRTDGTSETNTLHDITFGSITNPSAINTSFFVRITTYSDNGYSTLKDDGTVAAATVQTLTASAAVEEILNFCVGASGVNNATTAVSSSGPDYCSGIAGTSVDLGTLTNATSSVSPVGASNGGNNVNGLAMLNTNATNGASVNYVAIQQNGTNHKGTLRVSGANCNAGNVSTDQCIDAVGGTKAALTAGTEKFGMTIAGVNCGIASQYYTCNFSTGAYNLLRDTNYNPTGNNTYLVDAGLVPATTTGQYAWDENANPVEIAASSTIVGYEALIIKFAAASSLTTPTGSYTALADYIAVATY